MKAIVTELVQAGRDVLRIALVEPVKEGRPRPAEWPAGMQPVGITVASVFACLMLATLLSTPLRQADVLLVNPLSAQALPSVAVPLLLTAVVLTFAMVLTAAIHTSWWLRTTLLIISAFAMSMFTFSAVVNPTQLVVSGVAATTLLVFIGVRAFAGPTWWEFPVVLGLLTVALIVPWVLPGFVSFGTDMRIAGIEGGFSSLMPLILPAVIVAGFAPAQIVVTGAQAVADRPVSRGLFWTVFTLSVAGLGAATYADFVGDDTPTLTGIALSLANLIVVAAVIAALITIAKARRPPAPAAFPDAWSAWVYPVAASVAFLPILGFIFSFAAVAGARVGGVGAAGTAAYFAFTEGDAQMYYRLIIAAVALVISWRFARRSRLTEAIVLGTFAVMAATGALAQMSAFSFLAASRVADMGLIASIIAVAAGMFHLIRRRFDRGRATGVLTVVMLTLLYRYRDALSDPITTALTLAPVAMVVFGLLWRVITEAQITYGSSKRYPQSTRVLLFMANSLLATTGIAFVSLSRGGGTIADSSQWAGAGDTLLGQPLYVAGLVAALWLLLRPHDQGEVVEQLTDEAYDPVEAAADDAAMAFTPPPPPPGQGTPPEPTAWWPPPPPPP
ncbi:MAG: hypothetical protein CVT62_11905 [Actinobacteria bacterium HGW-Actinobacteria-2]|nr:MAG: hypothetical protein CVT62_11905 [Actinobacteria bacterium HGW-Actinobacteria-2]